MLVWDIYSADRLTGVLQRAGEHYGFVFDVHQPVGELGEAARDLLYWGVESDQFQRHFPETPPPATVFKGRFEGVIPNLQRRYPEGTTNTVLGVKLEGLFTRQTCPDCAGTRLRVESRQVQVGGRTIIDLTQMPLESLADWLDELSASLAGDQDAIASPVLTDLEGRIQRLVEVGVGYLSMERGSPSLSAGEAQRLRMASLLGSGLTGVLYVLDEPTIGLHQRDTGRLIHFLRRLRDLGNTVLVIEHDLEVIRSADHVIEFGPGAGKHGGEIVVAGPPDEIAHHPDSPTAAYLSGRIHFPVHPPRFQAHGELVIHGARAHNLKNITVHLPLGRLVAVTGVSGSGKSSLMFDILDRAARQRLYGAQESPGEHDRIEGWEYISRLVTVDQSPIGRSPRSNAATYTEVFSDIRKAFGALEEARRRKLSARHFSFNVPGGRCARCEGAGVLTVNMHFLPDVQVRCPVCKGKRFTKEVLAVEYRGASIADVLEMTIEEALALFEGVPSITRRLGLLAEVGLGYLQLGQPATTLSGGEAQRVKLARELARSGNGHTLYLLDEPTTGQHPADVARLLMLLQRLVEAGNSVFVIEHHLELISCVDWVIDLGPEGGWAGGELVAAGTPAELAASAATHTGRCLASVADRTPTT